MNKLFDKEIMEWLLWSPTTLSSGSSSSSSSDDEQEAEPKKKIAKLDQFVEKTVVTYTDYMFKQLIRLRRSTAYQLIGRFRASKYAPRSTNNMGTSAEKCVLICLWYMANTESFRQISDRFDVALSTAHIILVNVIHYLVSLRTEFIKWPNNEEKRLISQEFCKKTRF
ncbi:hypothetical protein PPYR_04334 [Photinus pyralis]|uniref:Transposase Helix-turn-helix domain-containing protein n=1 Tax=Photinus pyralis TaxID=7054 RepID=A0A5N4AY23_PHOPY|nr:hypothetical protein PPYR_04334 [Photinus pyralis]